MKRSKILQIAVVITVVISGCRNRKYADKIYGDPSIAGIYVYQSADPFCSIVDSLIVQPVKADSNHFSISHRTVFVRIHRGIRDSAEYQQEEWIAVYNMRWSILTSADRPDTLHYWAAMNTLSSRSFEYKKVL